MLRSMNSDFSPTWAKQDRYTTMLKPMYAPWRWTLYPFTTQNHQISLPVTLWVCLKIHDTPQIYQHLMVSHHQNIWYTLIHTQKLSTVHGIPIKISQNLMISHQNLSNNDGILMVFSWFIIIFLIQKTIWGVRLLPRDRQAAAELTLHQMAGRRPSLPGFCCIKS
jgi:hypothetical protein